MYYYVVETPHDIPDYHAVQRENREYFMSRQGNGDKRAEGGYLTSFYDNNILNVWASNCPVVKRISALLCFSVRHITIAVS